MTLVITDMRVVSKTGEGVQVEGAAGVRSAAPEGPRGETTAGVGGGGGTPDCHETNLKCFITTLFLVYSYNFGKQFKNAATSVDYQTVRYHFTNNFSVFICTSEHE